MNASEPHQSNPAPAGRFRVQNARDAIDRVEDQVLGAARRLQLDESAQFAIRLAVEESLANAFKHGHALIPEEPVDLEYEVSDIELVVRVTDRGPGFTPDAVPDPTSDENIELPSGRGLLLIRAYMTSVEFNDQGNSITMRYRPTS